ncbi:MAG: hypothetical protein QM638_19855 [Nocardioides sp.]|uniref:hypothetical protein n=1 Tax=Nocardioides sp. TaxID=35761 RepID=UPI0039E329B9
MVNHGDRSGAADRPGRRFTLLDRSRRWRLGALAGAVVVVLAAVVVVVAILTRNAGPSAAEVAEQFLTARSCGRLRALADGNAEVRLRRPQTCQALIDAANGVRTYGDPTTGRRLTRTLSVGTSAERDGVTQVPVTVGYAENGTRLPTETMIVELISSDGTWLVDDWGLAQ